MLARPRRSVLYMPGSNAKALAKAATLARRRAHPRSRGIRSPPTRRSRRATGRRGGAQRRLRRPRSRHPRQRTAYALGRRTISSPPPPPGRTPSFCPRSTAPARSWLAARSDARGRRAGENAHLGDDGDAERHPQRRPIAAVAADPASRLAVMVMGLNDLAKETRARLTPGRPTMLAWLANCVVAARAHGIDIIDGVLTTSRISTAFAPNACRAATWASTARRSSTRARSTSATRCSRPRPPKSTAPAPSSTPSRCPRTPARAHPAQRQDGRTPARRHGPPHPRDRRGDRSDEQGRRVERHRFRLTSRARLAPSTALRAVPLPRFAGEESSRRVFLPCA